MTDRKFFVGGNWKMNGNKASIDGIVGFLTAGPLDPNTGNKYVYYTPIIFFIFDAVKIIFQTFSNSFFLFTCQPS